MDRITKILYWNISWILALAYGCAIISQNLIRPDVDAFSFYEGDVISLLLMWFPLLTVIAIGVIYCFSMFDDEYKYARAFSTSSLFILALSVATLFIPSATFYRLPVWIYNVMLGMLFVANEIIHILLLLRLEMYEYSIVSEAKLLREIISRQKDLPSSRWGTIVNRVSFLFIVPFIFHCGVVGFAIIELIISFALLYPMIMLTKAYTALKSRFSIKCPVLSLVLFYAFVIISILLFKFSPGLSFLAIMTSTLMKYLVDNKIARGLCATIKQ